MEIFKEDARTGVSCGVNDFGEVFCGDDRRRSYACRVM